MLYYYIHYLWEKDGFNRYVALTKTIGIVIEIVIRCTMSSDEYKRVMMKRGKEERECVPVEVRESE